MCSSDLLATNVAETSVTIEGVTVVVDQQQQLARERRLQRGGVRTRHRDHPAPAAAAGPASAGSASPAIGYSICQSEF